MRRLSRVVGLTLVVVGLGILGALEAQEPKRGGRVVLGMGVEPENLDTIRMASAPAAMVSEHITQTLFTVDLQGNIVPELVESYEVSEDGRVWTLRLRRGITFHDGTPFNAEAVKFNLDRFLDPESKAPFRFLIARITDVEVLDEYTVRLTTDQPFAPMLAHLSHSFIGMLSPTAVQELGSGIETNPVGTGHFKMKTWTRGESILLERNPDYWEAGLPYLDEVMFRFIPEDAARVVALEAGEVHAIMRVPPADIPRLEADPDIEVLKVPSVRTIYIGFNNQKAPFTDVRVRRALNYCVDKEALVEFVLEGVGRVSDAPFSPGIFGYSPMTPYEYDPERAKELLAEAGYPDGFKVNLYHPTGRYLMDAAIAEAVQAQLKECGVEAELITLEWATYLATLRKPPEEAVHDMYLLGWGCVTNDADYCLYPLFHSGEWPPVGWHLSYYKNEEVDRLLDEARVTPDPERRAALYKRVIEIIWNDAPWLFLYSEVQVNAVRKGVQGLIHHPREYILATEAWLEQP